MKKFGNTTEYYRYNEYKQLEDIEVWPLFFNPHHDIIRWGKSELYSDKNISENFLREFNPITNRIYNGFTSW